MGSRIQQNAFGNVEALHSGLYRCGSADTANRRSKYSNGNLLSFFSIRPLMTFSFLGVGVPAAAFLAPPPRGFLGVVLSGWWKCWRIGHEGGAAGTDAGMEFVSELVGVRFDYVEAALDGIRGPTPVY